MTSFFVKNTDGLEMAGKWKKSFVLAGIAKQQGDIENALAELFADRGGSAYSHAPDGFEFILIGGKIEGDVKGN